MKVSTSGHNGEQIVLMDSPRYYIETLEQGHNRSKTLRINFPELPGNLVREVSVRFSRTNNDNDFIEAIFCTDASFYEELN